MLSVPFPHAVLEGTDQGRPLLGVVPALGPQEELGAHLLLAQQCHDRDPEGRLLEGCAKCPSSELCPLSPASMH